MSDALRKLIEAVEAGEPSTAATWHGAIGDNWRCGIRAAAGSVDAAIALCEALLPGWGWSGLSRSGYAHLYQMDADGNIAEYIPHAPARPSCSLCCGPS